MSGSEAHDHCGAPLPDLPPRDVLDTAGDLLRALAAPVRIAIVLQLRESARCVHELVDALAVPQPLASQQWIPLPKPWTWNSGSASSNRSAAVICQAVSSVMAFAAKLLWVSTAHFEAPVVPEV